MHIWNIKKLAEALREGAIEEKSQRTYLLTGMALLAMGVLTYPFLMAAEETSLMDLIDMVVYVALTVFGLYAAYKINERGGQKDFWLRYFSLFIPLTLRVILAVFVLTLIGYALLPSIFPSLLSDKTNWFDLLVSAGTEIYFVGMLIKYFKVINR